MEAKFSLQRETEGFVSFSSKTADYIYKTKRKKQNETKEAKETKQNPIYF
jgi:hypothetical protein